MIQHCKVLLLMSFHTKLKKGIECNDTALLKVVAFKHSPSLKLEFRKLKQIMTEVSKVVSLNTLNTFHVKRLCSDSSAYCCFRTYWAYVKILKRSLQAILDELNDCNSTV